MKKISLYSNFLHSHQISIQWGKDILICIMDVHPTNLHHVNMDQTLWNISSTLLNVFHEEFRRL